MKTTSHICSSKGETKYVGQMVQPSHPMHMHTHTNLKVPLLIGRPVAQLHDTDNAVLLWSPNVVSLCLIVP